MPLYEFHCEACDHQFDALTRLDDTGVYEGVKCPLCRRNDRKKKLISRPNFRFANPVGTDRWTSDAQGHDYRYKSNLPNVVAQREAAQRSSHMGTTGEIYGTGQVEADLNNDANWGEVK